LGIFALKIPPSIKSNITRITGIILFIVFLNALILPDYIQVVNKKHAFSPLAAIIKSFCGGNMRKAQSAMRHAPCAPPLAAGGRYKYKSGG
jgi:hypothetical protein